MTTAPTHPVYPVDVIGKLLNLTPRRVQQLVKEGVIPRAERGKYDLIRTVRGYVKYLQERAEGSGSAPRDLHVEKIRLVSAQADKMTLETQEMSGELIPAKLVELEWSRICSTIRSKVMSIPSRMSAQLFACGTIADVDALLKSACYQALADSFDGVNEQNPIAN